MPDELTVKRAIFWAAWSLLAFSAITSIALVAWFATSAEPWGWRTIVSLASVAFGLTTAALVWRAPSRVHVYAGMAVVALSLVRLLPPSSWGLRSSIATIVTGVLFVPLVRAAVLLPRS